MKNRDGKEKAKAKACFPFKVHLLVFANILA